VMNPDANIYTLGDYVYPTLDQNGKQITSWKQSQTFYTSQPKQFRVCDATTMDEDYAHESMGVLSYMYGLSTDGYKGSDAYNLLRSKIGCINRGPTGYDFASGSPKWDITPRETSPPPAP
jgi:hypothetical protein